MDKKGNDNTFENLRYGAFINVSNDVAPLYFPMHWHTDIEIIAPMQDNYTIEINNVAYKMGEFDLVVIMPGDTHIISSKYGKPCLLLQINQSLITSLTSFRNNLRYIQAKPVIRRSAEPDIAKKLLSIMRYISELYKTGDPFSEAEIYAQVLTFFTELMRHCLSCANLDTQDIINGQHYDRMAYICSYIIENCQNAMTLDDIALLAGFSRFYFSKLFKQYTGQTFSDYLTQTRIKRSESLLADPRISISDAGLSSGFGSLVSFNRAFRQVKEMTPSQFRQMYRSIPDEG